MLIGDYRRRSGTIMSEDFEPHLGRIGGHKTKRDETYLRRVLNVAYKGGMPARKRSSFTGSRIGRGRVFGTLAGAGLFPGGQRRVIVKARIARLKAGNLGAARTHLRYIQRDGVTQDGEPGRLYGRETDDADGKAFLKTCDDDRHQFRLIVSTEDATELAELKPFIRDFMAAVESDLGTKLDWVAVDHFNTGHPHTHIVIRGKDDRGQDLVIARDYVAHGFRRRAMELVTLELGPEIESDLRLKLAREVDADRFTRLDKALLRHADTGFLAVSAMPPNDPSVHAAHMARLRKLQGLGLAHERQTGIWEMAADMEPRLKALGARGDITKTMHRAVREGLARRRQWLVARSLGRLANDGTFQAVPAMLERLRDRDVRQAGLALSKQLGLAHVDANDGERVSGTYRQSIHLASGKYVVIEMAKEFALVPWRPHFEKLRGQRLTVSLGVDGAWYDSRAKRRALGLS